MSNVSERSKECPLQHWFENSTQRVQPIGTTETPRNCKLSTADCMLCSLGNLREIWLVVQEPHVHLPA